MVFPPALKKFGVRGLHSLKDHSIRINNKANRDDRLKRYGAIPRFDNKENSTVAPIYYKLQTGN